MVPMTRRKPGLFLRLTVFRNVAAPFGKNCARLSEKVHSDYPNSPALLYHPPYGFPCNRNVLNGLWHKVRILICGSKGAR